MPIRSELSIPPVCATGHSSQFQPVCPTPVLCLTCREVCMSDKRQPSTSRAQTGHAAEELINPFRVPSAFRSNRNAGIKPEGTGLLQGGLAARG